ncbi:BlaI/MecI/CopY family transcriptional regulator [Streptomyces luteireticuli]|uniref:BlaI/MecI/CopY family transcriptional regulator n=1 Tax=Streptomyces luteireticuli TaxID=173858 RepID=A0ABN0Z6C8_9ACTN
MIGKQDGRRPAGELEAGVMAALWAAGEAMTPERVRRALDPEPARTTVATILSRLHEKGLVGRERSGRGYAYFPVRDAQDAQGLTARRMHRELERDSDRGTVLARFVDQLSADDERLLRELLDAGDQ